MVVLATLVLWREGVHTPLVGEEGFKYSSLFLWLGQYWTARTCPSFCCKDFFVTFLNCGFLLMSILNSAVQSVPCKCNNMGQARQCWRYTKNRGCWVCCVPSYIEVHSTSVATRRNPTDRGITVLELVCGAHSSEDRHFCSRWQWHWQKMTLLTQTSHNGLTKKSVEMLYL